MDNFAEHCNRTLQPGGDCHLLTPPIPIDSSCGECATINYNYYYIIIIIIINYSATRYR